MSSSEEFCFLCKDNFSPLKSKIKVLGKSALDIPSLILKATKEDVNVNVERERFYICQMKCFNWLVRYQNALQKVEEISFEIQKDYQSNDSVHVKRLSKQLGRLPEVKKSLKFGDTSSIKMLFKKLKKSVLKYRRIISLTTRSTSKDLLNNQEDCQRLERA